MSIIFKDFMALIENGCSFWLYDKSNEFLGEGIVGQNENNFEDFLSLEVESIGVSDFETLEIRLK